ncbi:MAG: YhcH/YjgK/YiaL family protein [Planctomycetaceae bacterium]|jgi:YhcH/YjgK/YiaL family protein|nr:YhcH/YjgK/YiaL family protein [Planctomycetaceae bacterium]
MIYDILPHLSFYLPPDIRQDIETFVQTLKTNTPAGEYPIRGTDIFARVSEYRTDDSENRMPEVHRKYIDIQIVLSGQERVYHLPLNGLRDFSEREYQQKEDVQFFDNVPKDNTSHWLMLRTGDFAVFFPQDGHEPQHTVPPFGSETVRKAVIKVNGQLWI